MSPLTFHALGFLIFFNLLLAWFNTNFPQHLWNRLHGERIFTKEDLTVQASLRYGAFGDLWVCPLCLGTWMAVVVSFGVWLFVDVSLPVAALAAITWPGLGYWLGFLPAARAESAPPASAAPEVVQRAKEDVASTAQRTLAKETLEAAPARAVVTGLTEGNLTIARLHQAHQANHASGGEIDPLWKNLTMVLASPPKLEENPTVANIVGDYRKELGGMGANCPGCEKGALIRKYLAKLYDAGVR